MALARTVRGLLGGVRTGVSRLPQHLDDVGVSGTAQQGEPHGEGGLAAFVAGAVTAGRTGPRASPAAGDLPGLCVRMGSTPLCTLRADRIPVTGFGYLFLDIAAGVVR